MTKLRTFIRESNLIEGIDRAPTDAEMVAARAFFDLPAVRQDALHDLQCVFAPHKPLRSRAGMDVQVGRYVAPPGGPGIADALAGILLDAHYTTDPWRTHVAFEMLHPYMDGNGRTGRMLWAWQMKRLGRDPFRLSFLHRFYYQTLEAQGGTASS